MTNDPRADNGFEQNKPGTAARDRVEASIESLRQAGGVFVEAIRATRMAMVLTDPTLPGNPIVFANQSFLSLSGYGMDEVLGQQPYFMNGPDTDREDAERFRRILESDQDGVVETVQYAKNGRRFVATVLLSAFKDDEERTLHHFLSWADVTRRVEAEHDAADLRRTQAALRQSEERFRLIVENARYAAIFTMDPDGVVSDWHEGAARAFGYSAEEIIGKDGRILFTPEDRAARVPEKEFESAAATGKADNVRWHLRKDGSLVFIDGVANALRDANGKVIGFLKIGLDATERERGREHERMILAELQHRVRNTLSIIRSMVRRTGATARSVEEFEQNLDGRLSSFARTQAHVTRDPEGSVSLELIVRDELLAHVVDSKRSVVIEGPDVRLTPKQAETLGLAIHELTSNAMRHGALASDNNRVDVTWSLEGDGHTRCLRFCWREHLAGRKLRPPDRTGFGTELLERVVAYELDADTSIEFNPDGFFYRADIPLTQA